MALALDDQMRNQRKRDWARENGWPELADRGRLPAAVEAAYDAWEAASGGAGDGADFGAAAAALGLQIEPGGSPLDDDSNLDPDGGGAQPPPEQPAPAPATTGDGGGLPPVASLEDARARVAASKAQPAWAKPPGGGKGRPGAAGAPAGEPKPRRGQRKAQPQQPAAADQFEVTPALLNDMAGKLAMLTAIPGRWWQRMDPVCGGAFAEASPDIIDALVPVMARSQAVIRIFMVDALFFQLFALATAVGPVATAIYDHHYSEEAQRRKAEARGQSAAAQAQADEDLTMYPSAPVVVTGHVPAYRPPMAQM